jgi:hypothetical protein
VTVAELCASKEPLGLISKAQTKEMKNIMRPLIQAEPQPRAGNKNNAGNGGGGGKGGYGKYAAKGGGKGAAQWQDNRWCDNCQQAGHWTKYCWFSGQNDGGKGGKGGGGKGKGGKGSWLTDFS